jgi:hypothetical protein
MCISEGVSLLAFCICTVCCIYLYRRNHRNDRWIAILFGYFGTMQFLEYLMWTDQTCTGLNQWSTNLGFIHSILQPLISLLVASYFVEDIPPYVYACFALYVFTSLPSILKKKQPNQCSRPCKKGGVGLSWEYTNTSNQRYVWAVFCLALIAPITTMKEDGRLYSAILVATYILSHFISVSRCPNHSGAPPNGSWWCLMASVIPLFTVFRSV